MIRTKAVAANPATAINQEKGELYSMTYEEVQNKILEQGYDVDFVCIVPYEETLSPLLFSRGIQIMILEEYTKTDNVDCFVDAIARFLRDDFGSYYDDDEEGPYPGHEYGCYESPLGNTPDTGAFMIHRESDFLFGDHIVMYLQYER